MTGTTLHLEHCPDFLAEAQFDPETHIVRNVALLGPASRNGYRYTAEAMQDALPLYDGRPVFVDHAEASPPTAVGGLGEVQRKLRDYAGKVVNPRFENERIRGDLHLIGPNAEWLLSLFEASPSDIGMSHVVLARRNAAGDEVAKIEKVVSVDIVAFPATVQSFRESSPHTPCAEARHTECAGYESESPRSVEREALGPHAAGSRTVRRALIAAIRGEA
jgi:hypothetical protein